jgi:small GTP-binding protein
MENKFLKILVAGDATVGKTTLIRRYVEDFFDEDSSMTVGVNFFKKKVIIDGIEWYLQIWDIGGQERFRFMVENYLKGADGILLLYDITNFISFINIKKWVQLMRTLNRKLPIVLIANKYDLKDLSLVADYYAELCMKKNDINYYVKTSAKTGKNIKSSFNKLTKIILSNEIVCPI